MSDGEVTALLKRWREGEAGAEERLVPLVYPALRAIAQRRLCSQGDVTLGATELAHEAYIDLIGQRDTHFQNRAHFLAIASHVIRRVLIDHLRERGALKRGGGLVRVTLAAAEDVADDRLQHGLELLRIHTLLERLERIDARAARIVELRFFGGLLVEEAALVVGCSEATVKRSWNFARAWLKTHLEQAGA